MSQDQPKFEGENFFYLHHGHHICNSRTPMEYVFYAVAFHLTSGQGGLLNGGN